MVSVNRISAQPHFMAQEVKQNQEQTKAQSNPAEEKKVDNNQEETNTEETQNSLKSLSTKTKVGMGVGLAALAGVGIYIATRGKSGSKVVENAQDTAENLLKNFKEKLGKNDDVTGLIENLLASDNQLFKYKGITELLSKENNKYINSENWEKIYDSLLSVKPNDYIKPSALAGSVNMLNEALMKNGITDSKVLDKIIDKLPNLSDDLKLNIAHNLIDISDRAKREFPVQQAKKMLNILKDVKQEKFDYHPDSMFGYKDFTSSGEIYQYSIKYFSKAKIDEAYMENLKGILTGGKLDENGKLQLMNDLEISKLNDKIGKTKEAIQLDKVLLDSIKDIKAEEYTTPNSVFSFVCDKFSLYQNLFSHATIYDKFNVFSTEEKYNIAKELKEMAKKVKVNDSKLMGNLNEINKAFIQEPALKADLFFEKYTDKTSLDDIEKFTDEILESYKYTHEHFIDKATFAPMDKAINAGEFNLFRTKLFLNLLGRSMKTIMKGDTAESKRINAIMDKVIDFDKKYFKADYSKYYDKSAGGSKFNFESFSKDKIESAKDTLTKYLNKDEKLKKYADALKNDKLDAKTLKDIKRRLSLKYHPDRAGKDEQKIAQYTIIMQEINNSIEILSSKAV